MKASLAAPKARFELARKSLVDAIKARQKQLSKAVKELGKLQDERDAREQEVKLAAEREISHLREAAADLQRICTSEDEARRYFTVVDRAESEENEFNLNLPRYVDTFEPEKTISLFDAKVRFEEARKSAQTATDAFERLIGSLVSQGGQA